MFSSNARLYEQAKSLMIQVYSVISFSTYIAALAALSPLCFTCRAGVQPRP